MWKLPLCVRQMRLAVEGEWKKNMFDAWECRCATALLLSECERWPPDAEELPQEHKILRKIEDLWNFDEMWLSEFDALLSAACIKNPERLAPLERYLRLSRAHDFFQS
jgi:hypothetical protein